MSKKCETRQTLMRTLSAAIAESENNELYNAFQAFVAARENDASWKHMMAKHPFIRDLMNAIADGCGAIDFIEPVT